MFLRVWLFWFRYDTITIQSYDIINTIQLGISESFTKFQRIKKAQTHPSLFTFFAKSISNKTNGLLSMDPKIVNDSILVFVFNFYN